MYEFGFSGWGKFLLCHLWWLICTCASEKALNKLSSSWKTTVEIWAHIFLLCVFLVHHFPFINYWFYKKLSLRHEIGMQRKKGQRNHVLLTDSWGKQLYCANPKSVTNKQPSRQQSWNTFTGDPRISWFHNLWFPLFRDSLSVKVS